MIRWRAVSDVEIATTVLNVPSVFVYERASGVGYCGICRRWSRAVLDDIACGHCGACGSDTLGTDSIVHAIARWNRV